MKTSLAPVLGCVLALSLLTSCNGHKQTSAGGIVVPTQTPDFHPDHFFYQGGSTTFAAGATATVSVDAVNESSSDVGDFTVKIMVGPRTAASMTYDSLTNGPLRPGQSRNVVLSFALPTPGTYNTSALLSSPTTQVAESDVITITVK